MSRGSRPRLAIAAAVSVAVLLVGCAPSDPEKDISDLLDMRARAFATKDIELFKRCLAPNYQTPADAVREHFEFWDEIEMRVLDRSIVLESPDRAVVYQRYQLRVKKGDDWQVLPPAVEKLVLTRTGRLFKRWRISGGLLPGEPSTGEPDRGGALE
ncbi:MAG TPA: hypothetical protein ENF73_01910 [Proteobacteria bacterium]|nr:hypothetical protein [Pseudomonadota bacterium]